MKVVRPLGQVVKEGLKQNPKEMNIEGSKESDMELAEVGGSHTLSCQYLVSFLSLV